MNKNTGIVAASFKRERERGGGGGGGGRERERETRYQVVNRAHLLEKIEILQVIKTQ